MSDIPASKAMWNSPDNGTLQEAVRRGERVGADLCLVAERAPGLTPKATAAASSRPTTRNAAPMMAVFLGLHPGNSARLLPGPRARHKDFEDLFNGGGTALSLTC